MRGCGLHGLVGRPGDCGGERDDVLCLDVLDGDAEHLAANEVGDVDVLDCW